MSAYPIHYLWFSHDAGGGRWQRGDYGLHCWDGVEVRIDGRWQNSRIEHSSFSEHSGGWYLVTHPNVPLDGLAVRKAA